MVPINLAVIGGSGFSQAALLAEAQEITVETPYGPITPVVGRVGTLAVAFLARHGSDHSLLPHQLNYRAHLAGLKAMGVKRIIATSAVGSMRSELPPGSLVMADQFLDFTRQRPFTFFDQGDPRRVHLDFSEPYCTELRENLAQAAAKLDLALGTGGCYVCTEGPRYETKAEIRMFQQLGGDLVGMTGLPEVVLARELGLCYANLSMVTNWAAGMGAERVNHQEVVDIMARKQQDLSGLIRASLAILEVDPTKFSCCCAAGRGEPG